MKTTTEKEEVPPPTGDLRFDAILAAAAEHYAAKIGSRAPRWAEAPHTILKRPWWVSDLPTARALAVRDSPASFRRRNIFIERRDLESA